MPELAAYWLVSFVAANTPNSDYKTCRIAFAMWDTTRTAWASYRSSPAGVGRPVRAAENALCSLDSLCVRGRAARAVGGFGRLGDCPATMGCAKSQFRIPCLNSLLERLRRLVRFASSPLGSFASGLSFVSCVGFETRF